MNGVKKKKLTFMQVTLMTALNMMGPGVVLLPSQLAAVGNISVLAWIVTVGGSVALAYAFAKFGMLSRKEGGLGGFAEYAFGKPGAFLVNYSYSISLLIGDIAIAMSAAGYAIALFGLPPTPACVTFLTMMTLLIATLLNFGGVEFTGKIITFASGALLVPVIWISFAGWQSFSPELYAEGWNPSGFSVTSALMQSICVTLWAFLGIETACANANHVEYPEKNVPRAVLGATLGVAIIYIVSTTVTAGIVSRDALLTSTAPFGLLYGKLYGPALGRLVTFVMFCASAASLISWQFTMGNIVRINADLHWFPSVLSKISDKGIPALALFALFMLQMGIVYSTSNPVFLKQFQGLVDLAVDMNVLVYILILSSVFMMVRVEKPSRRTGKKILAAAVAGALYSFYALIASGITAVMLSGLATFAGWFIWGIVLYVNPSAEEAETTVV